MGRPFAVGRPKTRPGILGQTDPRRGYGILEFSKNLDSRLARKLIFEFRVGRGWRGNAPFAWRYSEPSGTREYPIIDVFAARHVRIGLGSTFPWPALGLDSPDVRIFRPQHIHAFPDRIDLFRILPAPRYSTPPLGTGGKSLQARRSVRVEWIPNGVRILNTWGYYVIEIFADMYSPGAFWFALPLEHLADLSSLSVRIIHTENVKIRALAQKRCRDYTDIHTFVVNHTDHVPWQGVQLDDYTVHGIEAFLGPKLRAHRFIRPERAGGWTDELADIVDSLVSPIPLLGDIYDFTQFFCAVATGRDFFDRNVSRARLVALGAAALIPVALNARSLVRELSKRHSRYGLQNVADEDSFLILRESLSPDVREAVGELQAAERQELQEAAERVFEGETLEDLIHLIEGKIGRPYTRARSLVLLQEVEAGRIPNDFLENLTGFNNGVLQMGYNDYIHSRLSKGFRRHEIDSALEWAVRRKGGRYAKELNGLYGENWHSKLTSILGTANRLKLSDSIKARIDKLFTRGLRGFNDPDLKTGYQAHRQLRKEQGKAPMRALDWAMNRSGTKLESTLRRELGEDWQDTIRLLRGDFVVVEMPQAAIKHWDEVLAPLGIKDYAILSEANEFFGAYYEAHHIFEQRFWRNDPRIDSFDQLEDGAAVMLPKNAKIMELMGGRTKELTCSHQEVTRLTDELIPKGMETQFSLQQMWDVHVYVYRKLGAPEEIYGDNLRMMFEIYKELLENAGVPAALTRLDFDKAVDPSQFRAGHWRPARSVP